MSIRTIALTLRPTAAEKVALLRLQQRFNAACDCINGVAWAAHEFNKVRLQRLCYGSVRTEYGLLAQHTIRAIAVVANSYKADKTIRHTFRADAAVVLDTPRQYRVAHNRASIGWRTTGLVSRRSMADSRSNWASAATSGRCSRMPPSWPRLT